MLSFLDPPEMVVLIVLVLLLFGGTQLPKLAKNLGKAQNEFKKGLEAGQKESAVGREETVEEKLARLEKLDNAKIENAKPDA